MSGAPRYLAGELPVAPGLHVGTLVLVEPVKRIEHEDRRLHGLRDAQRQLALLVLAQLRVRKRHGGHRPRHPEDVRAEPDASKRQRDHDDAERPLADVWDTRRKPLASEVLVESENAHRRGKVRLFFGEKTFCFVAARSRWIAMSEQQEKRVQQVQQENQHDQGEVDATAMQQALMQRAAYQAQLMFQWTLMRQQQQSGERVCTVDGCRAHDQSTPLISLSSPHPAFIPHAVPASAARTGHELRAVHGVHEHTQL